MQQNTLKIVNVPEEIKRKFKGICAVKGVTMRDRLVEMMIAEIDKS